MRQHHVSFSASVEAVPSIRNHLKPGIQALGHHSERNCIAIGDTRRLAGSVDIDTALKGVAPNDARWDYVIGVHRPKGGDYAKFVEFHPANTGSVRDVVAKAGWLKTWLKTEANVLMDLCEQNPSLIWVATGKVAFRRGSTAERQLAQAGIRFPVGRVELS